MTKRKLKKWLPIEQFGMFLSLLCAIHCLSLPLLLFFAPYFASSFAFDQSIEWSLVASSFLLASYLLYSDFRKHRQIQPLILLLAAIFSKLVEILLHNNSINWLFGLSLGVFISLAYYINYRHKSTCRCKA